MRLAVIPFDQPAGCFLLSAMKASDIIRIGVSHSRTYDPVSMATGGGVQRLVSERRVAEIADYAKTVDAAFPTPILLALGTGCYEVCGDGHILLHDDCKADIVDGQHRVRGLAQSGRGDDFVVPVVFIVDATEEQKALMFATINGKQTKVPASLIFDLFEVTESRSPQKTAHEIARALNSAETSPWYRRLKMLGTKTPLGNESLTQGTFVKQLIPLISQNPMSDMDRIRRGEPPQRYPSCIFNAYFVDNNDATILKVLLNYFNAARQTWPDEWRNYQDFILTRSVGFTGFMLALPTIYREGVRLKDLSTNYFTDVFLAAKKSLGAEGKRFTSADFDASGAGAGAIRDRLHQAVAEISGGQSHE